MTSEKSLSGNGRADGERNVEETLLFPVGSPTAPEFHFTDQEMEAQGTSAGGPGLAVPAPGSKAQLLHLLAV